MSSSGQIQSLRVDPWPVEDLSAEGRFNQLNMSTPRILQGDIILDYEQVLIPLPSSISPSYLSELTYMTQYDIECILLCRFHTNPHACRVEVYDWPIIIRVILQKTSLLLHFIGVRFLSPINLWPIIMNISFLSFLCQDWLGHVKFDTQHNALLFNWLFFLTLYWD